MITRYLLMILLMISWGSTLAEESVKSESSQDFISEIDLEKLPEFNQMVLKVASTYPQDGTHDYWWPRSGESSYDGCSKDVYLLGEKVMEGEEGQRTFCCGWTLEVFLEAYNEYLKKSGEAFESPITKDNWQNFQSLWFVEEINGPGPSAALASFNIGKEISRDEVVPGDFVQIWRRWDREKKSHGSGHSVIFLSWERDEYGEIKGIRYISTQPSTDGIGITTEYFRGPDAAKGVAEEFTHYGRVLLP